VWTDLFVHVERFIDGDRNAQIRLQNAPWTFSKISKRVRKHAIWLLIGVATGGAWIFYFADAPTLFRSLLAGTAPPVAYATIGILTATTYILGGLLREQVCIYMCPWPRIQGAMLDEKSLMVTYKYWRGEPRSHGIKRAAPAERRPETGDAGTRPQPGIESLIALASNPSKASTVGDCIDCNACVAVCPTGIDIREGSQIGCITCALCIDACDQVMDRIGRPRKLIGYTTVLDTTIAASGGTPESATKRLLRLRTLLYFLVWAGFGLGMLFALGQRTRVDISVSQDRNPTWVRLSDGTIRNNYSINVRNMQSRPREMEIGIQGLPGAVMWRDEGRRETAGRSVRLTVAPDQVAKARLFIVASGSGEAREKLTFTLRALDKEGGSDVDESFFERPEPGQ
jgi:polyferredoxin